MQFGFVAKWWRVAKVYLIYMRCGSLGKIVVETAQACLPKRALVGLENASGFVERQRFFAHVVGVLCENCVSVALQVCKNTHPWWRFALQWQQFVCWRAKASTPAFSKQGCCFLHYFLQNLRCRFVGWRIDKLVNGKGQLFVAVQFHKLQVGLQLFLPLQNGTT